MQGPFFPSKEVGILSDIFSQLISGGPDQTYLLKQGRIGVGMVDDGMGGKKLRLTNSGSLDVAYFAHSVHTFATEVLEAFPNGVENEFERDFLNRVFVQILTGKEEAVLPFGESGTLCVKVRKVLHLSRLDFFVEPGKNAESDKLVELYPPRVLLSQLRSVGCLSQCFGVIKERGSSS